METCGVWLRETRQAGGSTLDEVEAATRLRPRFLEALEAGDWAVFPGGEVQIRGFLRIYARYLGLPPDEVLARYDREVHGADTSVPGASAEARLAPTARPTARPLPSPAPQRPRMHLTALALAGFAVIALAATVAAAIYLNGENGDKGTTAAAITQTSRAARLVSTTAPVAPVVTPTFPVDPKGGMTLAVGTTEHVWVRVIADGVKVFEGIMSPEQVWSWSGQELVRVETGNGAGVLVTVNGQPQGTMCGRDQVCARAWGPTGEVTEQ